MIEKGTRFGSWSYDRFLFAGASGTVGLVHRTAAPFTIAVVKIHDGPKTTASRDEFLRERKFVEDQPLAGFMPEWYESGETADGTPWFVMQYAPRLPKKLGRKELKRVIDRVAAALQRLHRLGRLHCDVKRENIGLADGIAVLLDFGSLHRIAAALYHLAELYRDGLGVEQNLGKYRQLAEKAALLDSPEAKKLLTNLDALRSKRRRNPPANVENITDMRCSGSCKSEDM